MSVEHALPKGKRSKNSRLIKIETTRIALNLAPSCGVQTSFNFFIRAYVFSFFFRLKISASFAARFHLQEIRASKGEKCRLKTCFVNVGLWERDDWKVLFCIYVTETQQMGCKKKKTRRAKIAQETFLTFKEAQKIYCEIRIRIWSAPTMSAP